MSMCRRCLLRKASTIGNSAECWSTLKKTCDICVRTVLNRDLIVRKHDEGYRRRSRRLNPRFPCNSQRSFPFIMFSGASAAMYSRSSSPYVAVLSKQNIVGFAIKASESFVEDGDMVSQFKEFFLGIFEAFYTSNRELLAWMSCDKEDNESRIVIKKRGLWMVSEIGSTAPPEALRFGAKILASSVRSLQCSTHMSWRPILFGFGWRNQDGYYQI